MRHLRTWCLAMCFGVIHFSYIYAQQPILVDEFARLNFETLQMRLELFAIEVKENENSRALIRISSNGDIPRGIIHRYAKRMSHFLETYTRIPAENVRTQICKSPFDINFSLFRTPTSGSETSCDEQNFDATKSQLFDQIPYFTDLDSSYFTTTLESYGDVEAIESLKMFGMELKKNETSRGVLIMYLSPPTGISTTYRHGREVTVPIGRTDPPRMAKKILNAARSTLREHGVNASRIKLINGGYRKGGRHLELWFIPRDGVDPRITPNYFPRNGKSQKKQK